MAAEKKQGTAMADLHVDHPSNEHAMIAGVDHFGGDAIDDAEDAFENRRTRAGRRPADAVEATFGQLREADGKIDLFLAQNVDGVEAARFEVFDEGALARDCDHCKRGSQRKRAERIDRDAVRSAVGGARRQHGNTSGEESAGAAEIGRIEGRA